MKVASGRRILLGVCGGIAAYKAVELCRRLVEAGAHVVPVLTADATRFVGSVTFSALASEPARSSLWDDPDPIPHTRMGQQADLVVVAPATADLVGRYASGMADDLLTATLLATRAPVVVCPAMHTEMWEHPAVRRNIETLRRDGVLIVEPGVGRLAGGDTGAGRLAELDAILAVVCSVLGRPRSPAQPAGSQLAGVGVLVSAGGTREPIDPVRYLGNRSSGKQGHALAEEAAARGAEVTLVTAADLPVGGGVSAVRVETSEEMAREVLSRSESAQVVIMAAAVADFRPKAAAPTKIHKEDGVPDLVLELTPDILGELGSRRHPGQILVGFAAETEDVKARALRKLGGKGVDIMVANDVSAPGAGFAHDTNAVVVITREGRMSHVDLTDKRSVASAVLDAVASRLERRGA